MDYWAQPSVNLKMIPMAWTIALDSTNTTYSQNIGNSEEYMIKTYSKKILLVVNDM